MYPTQSHIIESTFEHFCVLLCPSRPRQRLPKHDIRRTIHTVLTRCQRKADVRGQAHTRRGDVKLALREARCREEYSDTFGGGRHAACAPRLAAIGMPHDRLKVTTPRKRSSRCRRGAPHHARDAAMENGRAALVRPQRRRASRMPRRDTSGGLRRLSLRTRGARASGAGIAMSGTTRARDILDVHPLDLLLVRRHDLVREKPRQQRRGRARATSHGWESQGDVESKSVLSRTAAGGLRAYQ